MTTVVLDDRVDVTMDREQRHVIMKGGARITPHTENAQSYSQSECSFSFKPPSGRTIVDRQFKLQCEMKIIPDSGKFEIGTRTALRQFPLSSIMESISLNINGTDVTMNTSDYIHALLCYHNDAMDRERFSTAHMPDNFQSYADFLSIGGDAKKAYQAGSAKNPLGSYGEGAIEEPRGGYPQINTISKPPTVDGSTPLYYNIVEHLSIRPLLNGLTVDEGLMHINQINITIRWKNNLNLLMSHFNTGVDDVNGITVTFNDQPKLLLTYITPDPAFAPPPAVFYEYHRPFVSVQNVETMVAGEVKPDVNVNDVTLDSIPSSIYVFARHKRSTMDYLSSDSFAAIDKLSLTWGNDTALLANSTPQQLWAMSRKNGLNVSYSGFVRSRGSVICIKPGEDFGLGTYEAPGVRGSYSCRMSCTLRNPSLDARDYELMVLYILEGSMLISPNSMIVSLGNLTQEMVRDALQGAPHFRKSELESEFKGGSLWSSFKHILHRVSKGVGSGASWVERQSNKLGQVVPEFRDVATVARHVGRGARSVQRLTGGRLVGGRR